MFNSFVLNNITRRLSKKLFKKFSNLTYEEFTERKVAGMINITTNVIDTLKESLANTIILVTEITVFFGIIIFLLSIEPLSILIITSLALVICYLFYKLNKNILTKWGNLINNNKESKLKFLYQSFNLIKNIKISKFSYFFDNFEFFNKKQYKYIFLSSCISLLPRFLFEIVGIVLITFSIIIMTKMSINKDEIIIVVSILGVASLRVLPAVARITNSISLIRFYKYSNDIVYNELVNKKSKSEVIYNDKKILSFEKLELNQVSFSRKSNKPILNEINFKLMKGDNIGIRGISGSGKTTFVDIICGLLKPSKGK